MTDMLSQSYTAPGDVFVAASVIELGQHKAGR